MQNSDQSIFLKAIYLEKEYEEVEEFFLDNYEPFFKEVEKHSGENYSLVTNEVLNKKAIKELSSEDAQKTEDAALLDCRLLDDEDIKSLYKRIVKITHPDKHAKYLTKAESSKLIKVYQKCVDSIKNENLFSLLVCANSLYLDIPELKKEHKNQIKNECKSFEEKIDTMKKTYIWHWATTKDKEFVVNEFIKNRAI